MIILLSPSKTFSNSKIKGNSIPIFKSKEEELRGKLKNFSLPLIKKHFNISDKLANEVYNYYQSKEENVAAIELYEGVQFKELKHEELNFKDNNLYIISALYGLLRPFDNVCKYRLDFNFKALGNLYNYWRNDIKDYLESKYNNKPIINLASKEFHPLFKDLNNVINIEFVSENNKRISSVLLKQLRGNLARLIINKNIKTINELKELTVKEFKYNTYLSSEKVLYFTKS